jgi:hypothetical protein
MPNEITKVRAMSCCSLGAQRPAVTGLFNAVSDWAAYYVITIGRQRKGVPQMSAQTETKAETMRIKDVRQGLHTLLHTQDLDGLLHLYERLETRGRVLLLCLLGAEAGWLILVNAWLRLERAYLKLRLFLRV